MHECCSPGDDDGKVTQSVRHPVFNGGRGALFAGQRALTGVQVLF